MKHALPLALLTSVLALAGAAQATPVRSTVGEAIEDAEDVQRDGDDGLSVPGSDVADMRDERSTDLLAVDLVDDASDADIAALEAKYGIKLEDNSPDVQNDGKVDVVRLSARIIAGKALSMDELITALSGEKLVEAVEPVTKLQAFFVPNDPKYSEQWHLKRAGAEKAWETHMTITATARTSPVPSRKPRTTASALRASPTART